MGWQIIIGAKFAYGHIPKTGGDAVHQWLSLFPDLLIDSTADPAKHNFFWERNVRRDTYALSIRRLPMWLHSYLHELKYHRHAAEFYGIPPDDTVRAEHAFRLTPDRYLNSHQKDDRVVTEWLRMECLFDDTLAFIDKYIEPVSSELLSRLELVVTKSPREYDHDPFSFFSHAQVVELYERNPVWSDVERKIYGGLLV